MDLSRVIVFFLTHLITLDFNSAESGNSDTVSDETTTPYIPARFAWASRGALSSVSEGQERVSTETDDEDLDPQARVVYWIPSSCDSLFERGYTCVGCGESLHCMAGNFALRAVCYGRRPYCNNGVCSNIPGEKCKKEGQGTHIADSAVQPVQETHLSDPAMQPAQETHISDSVVQADVLPANTTVIANEVEHIIPTNIDGAMKN